MTNNNDHTINNETYDDLIGIFAETAVILDDSARAQGAREVSETAVKVGRHTARIDDADTVVPGADRALLTVCAKTVGKGKSVTQRGLLVQRDIVQHPYLKRDDGTPQETWLAVRFNEYPSIEAAFEAIDGIRRAMGRKLREEGVEYSTSDAPSVFGS